jgi:hypothetical protein
VAGRIARAGAGHRLACRYQAGSEHHDGPQDGSPAISIEVVFGTVPFLKLATREQVQGPVEAAEVSIRLETFERARHRQELRKYTDLELILSGRWLRTLIENEKNIVSPFESPRGWKLQIEDAIAEWRIRQESRRAGVGVCLCHTPGSQAITSRAQMWKTSGYEEWLARRLLSRG